MKHVTIVLPEGNANLSSITGTLEILGRANEYWQKLGNKPCMEIRVAGFMKELKLGVGVFSVFPVQITELLKTDLVIIPSVSYDFNFVLRENAGLVRWIRDQYDNGAEIASICTGAFLLAATGLLDGKSCSKHWNAASDFRRLFPQVDLQPDKLVTVGDRIYTNGGAYSFLNMVLFLIEQYFDRQTMIYCSKVFQIDIDRTTQSPFFIFQSLKNHGDEMVCRAQSYIEENLAGKISFGHLAVKLATSRRNFDRRFIKATGHTPVDYLQRVKVEVAKKTLEKGKSSIFEVMNEVGYTDGKAFREVFRKITGLSPLDYKAKYSHHTVFG